MDASKAIQALIAGDFGQLTLALGPDESSVVTDPNTGAEMITARFMTTVLTVMGGVGGTFGFETVEEAHAAFEIATASAHALADGATVDAPVQGPAAPDASMLADLGMLLDTDTITADMFTV